MNRGQLRLITMVALTVLSCTLAFGQITSEGYELMLQITTQTPKPNLAMVLDTAVHMGYDSPTEIPVGVDSTGFPYWKYDAAYGKTAWPSMYGSWPGGTAKYVHVYWLVGGRPSRMAMVKNAMGSSVTLYDWTPPTTYPAFSGYTIGSTQIDGIPWFWKTATNTSVPAAPSTLATPTGCPTTTPVCPIGTITSFKCPVNLIGQTNKMVNWGLVTFSTTVGDCNEARVIKTFDLTESGDVTVIQNALKLKRDGGLDCAGYANTRGAMNFMKHFLAVSEAGGTIYDSDTSNHSVVRDEKFFNCNRPVGCILITGGPSSACNENDTISTATPPNYYNWVNPCGTTPYKCNVKQGTFDCDRGTRYPAQTTPTILRYFEKYAAGRINELWNTVLTDTAGTRRLNARTWVIGFSSFVNPCELNFNAYMGRTDASAPKGDGGFNITNDLARLPRMQATTDSTTGKITYSTLLDNEESVSNYNDNDPRTTNKPYAYITPGPSSEPFVKAVADILSGVTSGDFATSPAVGTPSTAGGGNNAYLTSTEFPDWKGHLYCYDTNATPPVLKYDIGAMLATQDAGTRKIYTWDSSNAMVEVTPSSITQLQTIAAAYTPGFTSTTLTTQVVDFIRGNDGYGVMRGWKLGSIFNSTPVIIGRPEIYKQGTVDASHADFATQYIGRKPLLYVGSDDGMLHCFVITKETDTNSVLVPGYELFALIPPNLLAKQVTMYDNFKNGGVVTGQNKTARDHAYGVANSVRYGDVYFPSESKWKTVLFLTEGPGGDMLAAVDATDPFTNATGSTGGAPAPVLWHFTGQTCPELKNSWSMPALAPVTSTGYKGVIGSGYDNLNATTAPQLLVFDPVDGTMVKKPLPGVTGSYVRNQASANSLIYKTDSNGYYSDNLADLGVQADLNGRLWFYRVSDGVVSQGINVSPAPIYYPPAVSGFKKNGVTYDIYAFATGSYFEKDVDVTGASASFIPKIYIVTNTPWSNTPTSMETYSIALGSLTYTYEDENGDQETGTIGDRAQVVSAPILLVPTNETKDPIAIFAVYDPETPDCAGTSYIITMTIGWGTTGHTTSMNVTTSGASAGTGTITGFSIVGGKVVVTRSGVGEGQRATMDKVGDVNLSIQGGPPQTNWWRELQ